MRPPGLSSIALLVAAALVLLAAPAADSRTSGSLTIRLVSVKESDGWLKDGDPRGEPNAGDVFWVTSTLRNAVPQFGRAKGASVGSDVSNVRVVSTSPAVDDVTFVAKLPGGLLRGTGRVREGRTDRIPVTGGTGKFAGARGVLESSRLDGNGDRSVNVFRLRLP